MSAARKPRPIGPQAVKPVEDAPEDEGGEVGQGAFEAFQDSLSTDELLDWDDAAGGVIGTGEVRPTLRLLLSMAWIVRRRQDPRLTWRAVRKLPREEAMALIAGVVEEFADAPKGDIAPGS